MPSNMPDARAVNEALRRARELQHRAIPQPQPAPVPPPEEPIPLPEEPTPPPEKQPQPVSVLEKPASPLDFLLQDRERTLILALLILLSGENCGTELLFALMYLLI